MHLEAAHSARILETAAPIAGGILGARTGHVMGGIESSLAGARTPNRQLSNALHTATSAASLAISR
jgi:hypothetical protein